MAVSFREFTPKMTRIRIREQAHHGRYSARAGGLFNQPSSVSPFSGSTLRLKTGYLSKINPSSFKSFNPLSIDMSFQIPTQKFADRFIRAENRFLFKSGAYVRRTMRSTLNRKPPQQYTKSTRKKWKKNRKMTARYKREVLEGAVRAPYRRVGTLRQFTNFAVNKFKAYVVIGPEHMPHLSAYKTTRSKKTIPQLLNEGGPAEVLKWRSFPGGRRESYFKPVIFKSHPYVQMTLDKSGKAIQRNVMQFTKGLF